MSLKRWKITPWSNRVHVSSLCILTWVLVSSSGIAGTLAYGQSPEAPVITLPSGDYFMPQSTTITDATSGAVIQWCYSARGKCAPGQEYREAIYINPKSAETICANARVGDNRPSQIVCANYVSGTSTAAAAPALSLREGAYAGPRTVRLTTTTPRARIYYTLDGSAPDYTSTVYTGPLRISATTTIRAIAGVPAVEAIDEDNTSSNWKEVETCANDNPGACTGPLNPARPPDYDCCSPTAASSPGGTILTGDRCLPGGDGTCMEFTQTPLANHQTNALWPRTSQKCDRCTWFVSRSNVFYGANSEKASAFEHDQQDFDKTDNYNMQFGMQCKRCTTEGNWEIGGTTNTPWIATGIRQPFIANTWHSLVKEDHWNLSELAAKPCSSKGEPFPCQYFTKLILDGHVYDLQDPAMCPARPEGSAGAGCTITTDYLEKGFGSNVSDQYQIDGFPTSEPVSLNTIIDGASFAAFYDPSPETTATYTISPDSQRRHN